MEPGDYVISAWGNSGAITSPPRPASRCDLPLSLAVGDDFSYFARWEPRGDCVWMQGELP